MAWRNIEVPWDSNLMRQLKNMAFYGPVEFPPSSKDLGETVICKHLEANWRWHFVEPIVEPFVFATLLKQLGDHGIYWATLENIYEAIWRRHLESLLEIILDIVARILEYKLFGALRKANYINLEKQWRLIYNQLRNKLKRSNKILAQEPIIWELT